GGSSLGCDSVVTLDLTINSVVTSTDVQTACVSYDWIDGNTYTVSTNSPTWLLTNSKGCDSTVTLNLTIKRSNTGTATVTACDSYTWIDGNTYTTSTSSPTHTLTNSVGCDSVVTLNLTINSSTTGIDVQSHCGSYTWIDGNNYTSSTNTPTWVISGGNSKGCDSTVTLNLTITPIVITNRTEFSCFSYTVPETGNVYTTSGVYRDSVLSTTGCYDYFITTLTINTVSAGSISLNSSGLTVSAAGQNYRWLDCDNGFATIQGETNQSFVPTQNGNYACMVYSNQGCKDTTACFAFNSVGILAKTNKLTWNVYPNPAVDKVTISIKGSKEGGNIKIYNTTGKLVYEDKLGKEQSEISIDISNMASGVYTIMMQNGSVISSKKLIIN
ncbi:MAG: T9SS type A sorting domain-containing protein, partial [Flavobacteriales bacterium]